MLQRLTANAELDLLTKAEMHDVLRSWMHESVRGAKYRRRSMTGTVTGAGELLMGGGLGDEDVFGPGEGFVWAITRLTVIGIDPTNDTVNVYVNDASPSQIAVVDLVGTVYPGRNGLVLQGGDNLMVAGVSLTAAARVTVSVQIKEVPTLMAWAL